MQPGEQAKSSSFGKLMVVVVFLGLIGLGGAFIWQKNNPPRHFDFEPIYAEAPPNALKVLWVGNSHMWWWDLPVEVQKAADAAGSPMWFELIAEPGVELSHHLRSGPAMETARSHEWDIILVQPQSVEPAVSPEQFAQAVKAWEAVAEEQGAKLVVWAPWGRDPNNDGYGIYERPWSGGSLAELNRRVEKSTADAIESGSMCPLGAAWEQAYRKHPRAPLWSRAEGNHASQLGAYLTTAMLYACLWKKDPRELTHVPELVTAENAEKLRIVAWETAVEKGIIEGDLPLEDGAETPAP